MEKSTLKANYEKAVNDYLKAFCKKHDYEYDPDCWVGGYIGTVACIADYFVDMEDIITDIELNAPKDEFVKWYDYTTELNFFGVKGLPNFCSWVKGCPRMSKAAIEELRAAQKKVKEAKEVLERLIKEGNIS